MTRRSPAHKSTVQRPARGAIVTMLGLTVVIVAFFASYASAFGKPVAHHVPVAVAAPPAVLGELRASPALRVQPVAGIAQARAMVADRGAYGALVLPRTGPATLLVAGGAGHPVAAVLTQFGQQLAGRRGIPLHTQDIAPLSPNDPNGSVEFYCVVFLGIGGAVGATALRRVLGPARHVTGALRRLMAVAAYAGLLAICVAVFTDLVYGALAGHFWPLFLTLWLFASVVCLALTGLAEGLGSLGALVGIATLILFGNTSSGGAVPRPLLDGFYAALSPVLPQGAALSAIRGVQYFGDRGMGEGLLCLAIWAVAGLALLGLGAVRHAGGPAAGPATAASAGPVAAGARA
jgi:hypothetical protein